VKRLNAIGFKICLELYVKARIKSHAEVPIVFGVRTVGESKLTSKVIINYLNHLKDLYLYQMPLVVALVLLLVVLIVGAVVVYGYQSIVVV
jgi:dolichol-phosphate mannosyltransferase